MWVVTFLYFYYYYYYYYFLFCSASDLVPAMASPLPEVKEKRVAVKETVIRGPN